MVGITRSKVILLRYPSTFLNKNTRLIYNVCFHSQKSLSSKTCHFPIFDPFVSKRQQKPIPPHKRGAFWFIQLGTQRSQKVRVTIPTSSRRFLGFIRSCEIKPFWPYEGLKLCLKYQPGEHRVWHVGTVGPLMGMSMVNFETEEGLI